MNQERENKMDNPDENKESADQKTPEKAEGEIQESKARVDIRETENGLPLSEERFDDLGRLTYEKKLNYKDQANSKEGEVNWAYEKHYSFSEEGQAKTETGSDLHKINAWQIEHNLDKNGETTDRTGEITDGIDKGHKWEQRYSKKEGMIVMGGKEIEVILEIEEGSIIEQGENPNKEPTGHRWKKTIAREKATGKYITHWGEKTTPQKEGEDIPGTWGSPPDEIK